MARQRGSCSPRRGPGANPCAELHREANDLLLDTVSFLRGNSPTSDVGALIDQGQKVSVMLRDAMTQPLEPDDDADQAMRTKEYAHIAVAYNIRALTDFPPPGYTPPPIPEGMAGIVAELTSILPTPEG